MDTSIGKKFSFGLPEIVGTGTWLLVFSICLYWLSKAEPVYQQRIGILISGFILYLCAFIFVSSYNPSTKSNWITSLALLVQLVSSYLLIWYFPIDFLPILTVIWISLVSYLVSLKHSISIMLVVVFIWYVIEAYHWQHEVVLKSLLYTTFHFFAIMMSNQTKIAQRATENANQLNAQLMATQNLLTQATRLNERSRIARDLHDLVGHHMTALIINLQIISRLTEGDIKQKVDQCHSISKLLLSDIREAVTSLKQNQALDFNAMLKTMIQQVPRLKIKSDIQVSFELEDITLVTNLLSIIQEAITNSLRHSGASQLWIKMQANQGQIYLEISDNGQLKVPLKLGNGLTGMKERIGLLDGQIDFVTNQNQLKIKAAIPLVKEATA